MDTSFTLHIKRKIYQLLILIIFTLFFIAGYSEHNAIAEETKSIDPFSIYNIEAKPTHC